MLWENEFLRLATPKLIFIFHLYLKEKKASVEDNKNCSSSNVVSFYL